MQKPDEKIYIEEKVTLIRLRGSRIFDERYHRHESYDDEGEKVILFREKPKVGSK